MNADKLINSSHEIQEWFEIYDQNTLEMKLLITMWIF